MHLLLFFVILPFIGLFDAAIQEQLIDSGACSNIGVALLSLSSHEVLHNLGGESSELCLVSHGLDVLEQGRLIVPHCRQKFVE